MTLKKELREKCVDEPIITNYSGIFKEIILSGYQSQLQNIKLDLNFYPFLEIDTNDLPPDLFDMLIDNPGSVVEYARNGLVATGRIKPEDCTKIAVRFINFPAQTPIGKLNSRKLNNYVSVYGIVKNITAIIPRFYIASFDCTCGRRVEKEIVDRFVGDPLASECHCGNGKYTLNAEKSIMRDAQFATLQETPEGLKGGQMPASIVCELYDDLCGRVLPGNRIVLNGVLRAFQRKGKSVLTETVIITNSIEYKAKEYDDIIITDEEEARIKTMATDPEIFERVAQEIAPSVLGHTDVKQAIALQLFGGYSKPLKDGTKTRGDIHILLVGDPGIAKSQILSSVRNLSPRAVMSSGKMSSTAGLTATVVKDATGAYTLEAGAAVLADKGMLIVDEIDKMRDEDRDAMHTAMEQQEVSINKAGINTTLYTRCSILAAANPKLGRFDLFEDLASQVELSPVLLSRFDLIFIMLDSPNTDKDNDIANFIMSGRDDDKSGYDLNILRKYIAFSRRNVKPVFDSNSAKILVEYYTKMRGMGGRDKPMPITARQLEALKRLAEASARSRLSETITDVDANRVVSIMYNCLKGVAFDAASGTFDTDKMTGTSKKSRDVRKELISLVDKLANDSEFGLAKESDVLMELVNRGFDRDKINRTIADLCKEGFYIQPRNNTIKRV